MIPPKGCHVILLKLDIETLHDIAYPRQPGYTHLEVRMTMYTNRETLSNNKFDPS